MAKKAKKETKKVMKKTPQVVLPKNNQTARNMINKVLKKFKGLVVVENAHGAVQVKRDGKRLFAFRKNGKCIISHPIYDGKERVFKHPGDGWNELSEVPNDSVTLKMLENRVKDAKTPAEYHKEFYPGKKHDKSGLGLKSINAKKRAEKLAKETGKKVKKTTTKRQAAKKAKGTVTGKRAKALRKVTKKAAATA